MKLRSSRIAGILLVAFFLGQPLTYAAEQSFTGAKPIESTSAQTVEQLEASSAGKMLMIDSKNELETLALAGQAAANGTRNIYDEFGRLIRREIRKHGRLIRSIDYSYDGNGERIEKVESIYDAAGRITKEKRYDRRNKLTKSTVFSYDREGKLSTKTETYYSQGSISESVVTAYRTDGQPSSARHTNASGTLTRLISFSYNPAGILTTRTTLDYFSNGTVRRSFLEYFSVSTRLIASSEMREYQMTGAMVRRIDSFFDAAGKLGEVKEYGSDGLVRESRNYLQGVLYESVQYGARAALLSKRWHDAQYSGISREVIYDAAGKIARVRSFDKAGNSVSDLSAPSVADPGQAPRWISAIQAASSSGLVSSYPDDTGFIYNADSVKIYGRTQAYTYDQALAGISLLSSGDTASAKRIFDFFKAEYVSHGNEFTGFWTVYNTEADSQWKKYEWRKGAGENAWMALFFLKYADAVVDADERARAEAMAIGVARWIGGLPHHEGAVAMGADAPDTYPNYGRIYSTENNFDVYALLSRLLNRPNVSTSDRGSFRSRLNNLKAWIGDKALDLGSLTFRRGGSVDSLGRFTWDELKSLDTTTWAVSALGPEILANDFRLDVRAFIESGAKLAAVGRAGEFGVGLFGAKGFDFSDELNARLIGRRGMKWVEGTNQMILAFRQAANFYARDPFLSKYFESLAEYHSAGNAENAIVTASGTGYFYADEQNRQIYYGSPSWKTTPSQSVASAGWVYFGGERVNPFLL